MPARLQIALNRTETSFLQLGKYNSPKYGDTVRVKPKVGVNPYIQGARGLLSLFVFTFHIGSSGVPGFSWQTDQLPQAVFLALQFSVELFFCVSGYLIAATLGRSTGPGSFLRKRAIRILPVLWVTIAVVVPLGLMTNQGVFATMSERDLAWILPANLVPLAGALPIPVIQIAAWSLSYELLFYLAAAAVWWCPDRRRFARVMIMVVVAGLVVWHPRAVFFIVGVGLAHTDLTRHPWLRHATRAPSLMLAGFFTCWYLVQLGGATQWGTLLDWAGDGRIGLAAAAMGFGMIGFAGLVDGKGWLGTVLNTRVLRALGDISLSFYLWHVIIIGIAKRVLAMSGAISIFGDWSQIVLVVVCFPIAIGVATVSARFIERDLFGWSKR